MINDAFGQDYYQTVFTEQVQLILHGTGPIQSSSLHNQARLGFTKLGGRHSNISKGIDPDGNSCYVMYCAGIKYPAFKTSITHISGNTQTVQDYVFSPASGNTGLHKYFSSDGIDWQAWPSSPQQVYDTEGNIVVWTSAGVSITPIPYADFGLVFGEAEGY